ncbi:MAG: IS110 family transposase [Bacteroidetes bacterium]|nr:IS110 family transposase [Bacteroidota bacterium]
MGKALEIVHPEAAGIDIGSKSFFVDAGEEEVKVFPTYTEGCYALRDYLKTQGIKTVAMESTGVYWVILYAVLEEAGIEVYLVNGRDAKNVPGRKSDVKDCQWLRQLHAYGLLKKSFIPDENIRRLRSYMRLRQDHIRAQATQTHLMQKALTQMNVRLTEVISDIMGASGSKMIAAILEGERDPEVLVSYCHESILKKKKDLVLKALQGDYRQEHLFALKQAHQTWHYYQNLINECDREVGELLEQITQGKEEIKSGGKRKPMRYNRPQIKELHQPLLKMTEGKDPTGIAGITDYSFLQIVSEVGVDMNAWKSEKHFVSWLKLAPMRSKSGNMNRRLTVKRTNKASLLFRNLAQGILTSKHLALGSFGRRIRARRGSGVAIKAIARKIACYYYRVMTQGEAFVEQGIEKYEVSLHDQRKKYLERLAKKMQMQLVPMG